MLVFIGKSGSGKTTVEERMIHTYGMQRVISHTTRKKRDTDVDGVNYFFVSEEELDRLDKENQLAEKIEYLGNRYAICKEQCQNDRVVVVAPEGFAQLLEKEDLKLFSVYFEVDSEIRKRRMLGRGDSVESVNNRLENDDAIFDGVEDKVNLVVNNNKYTVEEVSEKIWSAYQNWQN